MYNMCEPGKHYSEQKKPDAKGHFLSDATYMKCPDKQIHKDRKISGSWGLGGGEVTANEWRMETNN